MVDVTPQAANKSSFSVRDGKGNESLLNNVIQISWHFLRLEPKRSALVLVLLFAAGLAEGLGLAALLPILVLVSGQSSGDPQGFENWILWGLNGVGLRPDLLVLLSLIIGVTIIKAILVMASRRTVGNQVARLAAQLRVKLINALVKTKWQYFSDLRVGNISNIMTFEVNRASAIYASSCDFLTSIIYLIIYTSLALVMSWQVTLGALCFSFLLLFLLHGLVRLSQQAGQQQSIAGKALLSRLNDVLISIKPLKAMGQEHKASFAIAEEAHLLEKALRLQVYAKAALLSFQEVFIVIVLAGCVYIAITASFVSFAELLLLALLFQRMVSRIGQLQSNVQKMITHEAAYAVIMQMINKAGLFEEKSGRLEFEDQLTSLQLKNVGLSLGGQCILNDVSLTVPANKLTILHGPSGAGKTTIIDIITGLHMPDNGSVLVNRLPLSDMDVLSWRERIGYVPQETILFHDSMLVNISMGDPNISRDDVYDVICQVGLKALVDDHPDGLDRIVGERGMQLSGGQRQRISIARALIRKPVLLVLDEATASLDANSEKSICDLVKHLSGSMTVLGVSHSEGLIESADYAIEIVNGNAVEPHVAEVCA